MSQIFNKIGRGNISRQKDLIPSKNGVNLIVQKNVDNGYSGNFELGENRIFKAQSIIIGRQTGWVYYQPEKFMTTDGVLVLESDFQITDSQGLYLASAVNKQMGPFGYNNPVSVAKLKKLDIYLPFSSNGMIAFDYMEAYIKELEAERIKELEAYLVATGLNDYVLTDEEEKVLGHLKSGEIEWGVFKITDVFNITNTHNILKKDIVPDSGSTPYVTAGENNNGVSTCITYDLGKIERGNSILIAGKTMVVTYQPQDFFSNDSHNLSLNLRENNRYEKNTQLFLVSSLKAALFHKYEWGNSISSKKIKSDYISLPINNDKRPNYQIMSVYIKAIEKLVIKGVVEWKNKQIEATRDVANSD
ncbi:restriction endonuclease subunit S [Convivina intestini]|uniref:restriction endonuclease subunit S n=1 Tax=Convivina intestini TaxID=1505726 RepID=UPI001FAF6EFB|nr:restriction endonuclease subunit S [Convivina intestini]